MSVSFYINNKKTFLKSKTPMTVKECLEFSSQKIEQFAFDETQNNFDLENSITRLLPIMNVCYAEYMGKVLVDLNSLLQRSLISML